MIYITIDVTFTRIAISSRIYCTQFSFKIAMSNFPKDE